MKAPPPTVLGLTLTGKKNMKGLPKIPSFSLFFFHPTRMAALVWALLLLPCCEALVVIEHAAHQRHRPPPGTPHAEVPARREAAKAALKGSSFASSLRWRTTAEVDRSIAEVALERVHSPELIASSKQLSASRPAPLAGSMHSLLSAGARPAASSTWRADAARGPRRGGMPLSPGAGRVVRRLPAHGLRVLEVHARRRPPFE